MIDFSAVGAAVEELTCSMKCHKSQDLVQASDSDKHQGHPTARQARRQLGFLLAWVAMRPSRCVRLSQIHHHVVLQPCLQGNCWYSWSSHPPWTVNVWCPALPQCSCAMHANEFVQLEYSSVSIFPSVWSARSLDKEWERFESSPGLWPDSAGRQCRPIWRHEYIY